jgi:hypothetical protein
MNNLSHIFIYLTLAFMLFYIVYLHWVIGKLQKGLMTIAYSVAQLGKFVAVSIPEELGPNRDGLIDLLDEFIDFSSKDLKK